MNAQPRPLPWPLSPGDSLATSITPVATSITPVNGPGEAIRYAFVPPDESDEKTLGRAFDEAAASPINGTLHVPVQPGLYELRVFSQLDGGVTFRSGSHVKVEKRRWGDSEMTRMRPVRTPQVPFGGGGLGQWKYGRYLSPSIHTSFHPQPNPAFGFGIVCADRPFSFTGRVPKRAVKQANVPTPTYSPADSPRCTRPFAGLCISGLRA